MIHDTRVKVTFSIAIGQDVDPLKQLMENVEETSSLLSDKARFTPSSASSFLHTIFNTGNVMMGVSILSLPHTFKITGWIIGPFLLAMFAYLACFCGILLARVQKKLMVDRDVVCVTYSDVGMAVFGVRGRLFIQTIFTCELFATRFVFFSRCFLSL